MSPFARAAARLQAQHRVGKLVNRQHSVLVVLGDEGARLGLVDRAPASRSREDADQLVDQLGDAGLDAEADAWAKKELESDDEDDDGDEEMAS